MHILTSDKKVLPIQYNQRTCLEVDQFMFLSNAIIKYLMLYKKKIPFTSPLVYWSGGRKIMSLERSLVVDISKIVFPPSEKQQP